MSQVSEGGFSSILHPTDFSATSAVAFNHALRIALADRASFDILHVDERGHDGPDWSDFPRVRDTLVRWNLLEGDSPKAAVAELLGIKVRKVELDGGAPLAAMTDFLQRELPDLIVLATEGRDGLPQWLNPSVSERLSRRSQTTTLFVPAGGGGFVSTQRGAVSLSHVLVPVDHSPNPQAAVDAAGSLLRSLGAGSTLVEALFVGPEDEQPAVASPRDHEGEFRRTARSGTASEEIVRAAEAAGADLIVMATEGRNGILDALRGSTTERVLRQATCPLLAVPARTP